MKVKSLLTAGMLIAALTASAEYPLQFRDTGGIVNGVDISTMDYPVVEGTATDTYYGDPLFGEDGSITLVSNERAVGGMWYRNIAINGEAVPAEYNVFAVDYKSNRNVGIVLIPQEGWGNAGISQTGGSGYIQTDEWQTVYVPFDRVNMFTGWGDGRKSYFWVSTNDESGKTPGWELTIKNMRLLTVEEAAAECKSSTAKKIDEVFTVPNTDFTNDADPDMDNCPIYIVSEGAVNPILQTSLLVRPLPETCTTFQFDYKLSGANYSPNVHLCSVGTGTIAIYKTLQKAFELEACEDPYSDDFKTFSIDLSKEIEEYGFAKKFGSLDFVWVQFQGMPEDNVMWIKNPRWIDPNYVEVPEEPSGITEIEVATSADSRVFNMMGVEVKGELAPGLYIRGGKKFIVK